MGHKHPGSSGTRRSERFSSGLRGEDPPFSGLHRVGGTLEDDELSAGPGRR